MVGPGEHGSAPAENPPTLKEMAAESQLLLLKIETVFPLTIFPSSITVDLHKVSIVKRGFLRPQQTITAKYEDILTVEADVGPFFGALALTTNFFSDKPLKVNFLTRRDATYTRQLINGLLIAHKGGVDITETDPMVVRKQLVEIGEVHS